MRRFYVVSKLTHLAMLPLVLTTFGCGFLLTTAAPDNHESLPYFTCTESNVGPGIDAGLAGLSALNIPFVLASDYYTDDEKNLSVALSVGWAVFLGSSAVVGFNKTKGCREAKIALYSRMGEKGQGSASVLFPSSMSRPAVDDPLQLGERIPMGQLRMRSIVNR